MAQMTQRRVAGVLVPLFSLRNGNNWGIGEIPDIARFGSWLGELGHGLLQLLPVNEVSPGDTSPYSSLSAFALDPVYIALKDVEDFEAAGGERGLDDARRSQLDAARHAHRVDYATVRELKREALKLAFTRFHDGEYRSGSDRARQFRQFLDEQSGWIHDYGLFRALHHERHSHWQNWEPPLRDRTPAALDEQRRRLAATILFYQYVQWVADRQWKEARRAAASSGVRLKGDLPFMVSGHSADVWAHQNQFRLDANVGAPPDAFSADGQDWGLPPYNWKAMDEDDFSWLRERASRSSQLYDMFRVDHVVGFFRTYIIPRDGRPRHFDPPQEGDQILQGKRIMRIFQSGGASVLAEDLGVIPPFVRRSLTELNIPGYRVLRWEKEWDWPGQPFRDPSQYPALSIAVSGTHDTETMAVWWENMSPQERRDACRIPALSHIHCDAHAYFDSTVHQALLEALYGAGSSLTILPIQDVFGMRDRINVPATVTPENWSWRLPWSVEDLHRDPAVREAAERIAGCALRHRRSLYDPVAA